MVYQKIEIMIKLYVWLFKQESNILDEKATSNIRTAQALLSIMAAEYGIYHGPDGAQHIGERTANFVNAFADIKNKI